ncbi:hypothetical protein C8A00DRAFT_43622 [Chaetomidium leptoderma]|uniref:Metal homeostatis protein bsd2 n=1 Tax=Chaetomidium leptoderma TaxID=669021 RepID=A0AAN6VLQ3_9PEZI|nr:hypothetical protein C8A00DRAFT_43622 [Chaetomidium leptoderma]
MPGQYERVNAHDEDEAETPTPPLPRLPHPVPNSPPPSFRSRASSRERNNTVNDDLADAFDADGDESDDDADDRQRLVRGNSTPSFNETMQAGATGTQSSGQSVQPPRPTGGAPTTSRVYGGGIQSDGVFSNLSAKPERGDGEKEELPPSYEQAAADQAPPYWETTILAPGLGGPDDVYIDGLPVGSFFGFIWNGMISMAFQLVGFLLTYLLHSTHAAKNGSRAGLGITLIQYGFYMKSAPPGAGSGMHSHMEGEGYANPADPNSHDFNPDDVNQGSGSDDITGSDWAAYLLMIVGWFILIRAVSDYVKVRRHEQLVLQSPERGLGIPIIATGENPERVLSNTISRHFTSTVANRKLLVPLILGTLPLSRLCSVITATDLIASPTFHSCPALPRRSNISMAWRSSGGSNRDLIENLWRNQLITHPQVDRAHYAPSFPYDDSPQPIGHAATISAPHMHASAVENLLPYLTPPSSSSNEPNAPTPAHRRVLDIGSGSGYLTHIMAELVGPGGTVVGIEHIAPLRDLGVTNMGKSKDGKAFLESGRARFRVGDGRKGWVESDDGGEEEEKWDAIHVGAAAVEVHPELLAQLKAPGRMFIPVDDEPGGYGQHIWCVDKDEKGEVTKRKLFGVRYVPLTDAPKG